MKRTLLFAGIVIAALTAGIGISAAGDWEYRGRLDMVGPVEKNLSLRVLTEVRSKNDLHTHNESHFDIGLDYRVLPWLAVGPYYRHVTEEKSGAWRVEHRPHLDASLRWRSLGLSFTNRNRLEYRMIEDNEAFRYRARLEFKTPAIMSGRGRPYFSGEMFYAFDVGEMNKTRLIAGLDVRVFGSISLGVNYVLDSVKRTTHWQDTNALTLVLKYRP